MTTGIDDLLGQFLDASRFDGRGAVVTDLDGTAVHEHEGRIVIAKTVSHGLTQLRELGRPIVIDTLRFPLNVIESFGREWYSITAAPLPLVSLNGSLIGQLVETASGAIGFEELSAAPLGPAEIDAVLADLADLLEAGVGELALFYYPRAWSRGEIVWTAATAQAAAIREQYRGASEVFAAPLEALRERLASEEPCMVQLLAEAPPEALVAGRLLRPGSFLTAPGIDKLSGARTAAALLGIDLEHSVGAGDTPLDNFLDGVGLAVHVGALELEFRGRLQTLRVGDSLALGELLFRLADLQQSRRAGGA